MELMSLNDNYQPENVIETYESLLWTERYAKNGDFVLKSYDIQKTIELMPKESTVCIRESTVPMQVEDHKIEKKAKQAPFITVTGRSFETVLERRASVNQLDGGVTRTPWVIDSVESESDAAFVMIRTVIGDHAWTESGSEILPAVTPAIAEEDAIPEIQLILPADFDDNLGSGATSFEIKPLDLYAATIQLLQVNHHGLKAVRPIPGASKVGIEIYNGADLTDQIVFDARFDQFDDATYLLSERGSTNVGYVYGSNGSQIVLKTAGPEPSGLARRVLLLDQTSDTTVVSEDIRESRGLVELYKYNATALFDGQIAEQVTEGFGTLYHLGDIISLVGEYGLSQNVRVAEYIRTSDNTGEKAFPAFQAID